MAANMRENYTANEVLDYLLTLAEVDADTVDKIITGDPGRVVKLLGTCWIPTMGNLEKAYEAGVNVLITHEPTFYTHRDLYDKKPYYSHARVERGLAKGESAYKEMIDWKKNWIDEHGMTIMRCHDVMDVVDGFGMSYALGRALGFGDADIVAGDKVYKVYKIEPDTAYNVSMRIAKSLKQFNQGSVQFYGDMDRIVKSVGIGTGCYCDPIVYMEYSAGYYLAINDAITTWTQTVFSNYSGLPMGVIDHGASEEAGMRALCGHLNENSFKCVHIDGGAGYKLIIAP